MDECKRFRIAGKVQGVYFRAATKAEADRLGITGWVRNVPSGEVEVFACGKAEHIDTLAKWLGQGPPRARVTSVQQYPAQPEQHHFFDVRDD